RASTRDQTGHGVRARDVLAVQGRLERGAHRGGNRRHGDRTRSDHAIPRRTAARRRRDLCDRRRPAEDDARARRDAESRRRGYHRSECEGRKGRRLMAVSVVMPALEMAQDTGKLLSWRKKEGERVKKGEPLLDIETDKAVVEVEAPGDGILSAVTAREGAVIP